MNEAMQSEAMSLDELKRLIEENISDSAGYLDSTLSADRERLTDRYYGRPYGDEREGFSQVVSRDIMETTEWMLAQLLRVFTGERFCEFSPFGQEDVESSEQQTDFTNHVIMQDSGGTVLFYDWFKDALLHRVGIVHWGYEETAEPVYETYTGLDPQQAQTLLQDAELLEMSERQEMVGDAPAVLLDLKIRRVKRDKKLKVIAIPGEEFFIDREARDIDSSNFTGHKVQATKSDLKKLGVSDDVLDKLSTYDDDNRGEGFARDVNPESDSDSDDEDRYWLHTCYVRADMDGDGIAELLCVRYVGGEIIDMDHAMEVPYASLCPVRTPHRFTGLGYADVVEDIQRIKTVLWRQALDNLYLANQPMKEVVDGQVNLGDLEEARVGGSVRVKQPGMIREIVTTPMLEPALGMVNYIDSVREERTGLSPASMGRDADQIHDTAKGMAQMVSQSQMRVELVARLFAETGVKRLFLGIYNAIVRNQDPPRMVRLRGKFVQVDPREWRERNDVVVTVGLGAGTRESQIGTLQSIATMQQNLMQQGVPLVTVKNLQHTLTKLVEVSGYRNVDSFLTPPEQFPPPPPPPESEAIQIAKIQLGIEQEKRALEGKRLEFDAARAQMDAQKTASEMQAKERDAERQHALKIAQIQAQSALDVAKLKQDDRQFYDGLFQEGVLAREKQETDAESARKEQELTEKAMKELETADEPS